MNSLPEALAMLALIGASGFFSCSEAALFSLRRAQRAAMSQGSQAEREAIALLAQPDRLLTAILFWNLMVNMAYFALASIVSLRLARDDTTGWAPQAVAFGSLLVIILFSELAPKNLGVLNARGLAVVVTPPLRLATKLIDPLVPWLQSVSDASARILLPRLEPEPYLGVEDLERAVEHGGGETHEDATLLHQERLVLQRVVDLASANVAELMQPRRRCVVLTPPLKLDSLEGEIAAEYVLLTEPDGDQIEAALPTDQLALAPPDRLDRSAEPVAYVPWCASAAATLGLLRKEGRRVAAIVNELGETVGVVTVERLLDAVLRDATRADPGDAHAALLRQREYGVWEASAATPLRRVAKRLRRAAEAEETNGVNFADLDATKSVTVGGLLREKLQRSPRRDDSVVHVGLRWTVIAGPESEAEADSSDDPVAVLIEPAPAEPESQDTAPPHEEDAE